MTFTVFLSDRARTDIDRLPEKIRRQVVEDLQRLETQPFPDGKRIKKLKGFKEDLYRLRAGDYRIVFLRQGAAVSVARVLAKKDFQKVYG